MSNPIVYSIVILIAALVGYAAGLLAHRQEEKEKGAPALEAAAPSAAEPAPEAPPAAPPKVTPPSPTAEAALEEHTALRVLIDKKLRWHLELDEKRLENGPENITAEQKQRLISVLVQVRPWLETKTRPPQPAPSSSVLAQIPPVLAAAKAPDSVAAPINLVGSFRSVLQSELSGKKTQPAGLVSIIGLIDDILQKNIAGTPLASRAIRMEDGGLGEVRVVVGLERYTIDSVPDPQIKAAIQQAIAEFNQKQ